ncbi:hypothetical protein, partial [Pontimicrobium sp. MEBiC01747]
VVLYVLDIVFKFIEINLLKIVKVFILLECYCRIAMAQRIPTVTASKDRKRMMKLRGMGIL